MINMKELQDRYLRDNPCNIVTFSSTILSKDHPAYSYFIYLALYNVTQKIKANARNI